MFSRMEVYCPICRGSMDGMKAYGRDANCCGRECYEEWKQRRAAAILGGASMTGSDEGAEGRIVDPTAKQFPSAGKGVCRELSDHEVEVEVPIGICASCGKSIYPSNHVFGLCSKECATAYVAYVNSFGIEDLLLKGENNE